MICLSTTNRTVGSSNPAEKSTRKFCQTTISFGSGILLIIQVYSVLQCRSTSCHKVTKMTLSKVHRTSMSQIVGNKQKENKNKQKENSSIKLVAYSEIQCIIRLYPILCIDNINVTRIALARTHTFHSMLQIYLPVSTILLY